ncbi:MAG TPA: hypothetical protein VGH98_18445 [Gemmatimonadaceae bacterium]|jgi:Spy/CpxP family protein refolding chaperone
MLRRTRVTGAAVIIVVFVSGALTGAAVEHLGRDTRRERDVVGAVPTASAIENLKFGNTGVPLMYEELGLSPEQRARIRGIVAARRPEVDSLLRDSWPRLRAVVDTVRLQVEQVLTPEQRTRLTEIRRRGLR